MGGLFSWGAALIGLAASTAALAAPDPAPPIVRYCWLDATSGAPVALFPRESDADPADPDHRTRPAMRLADGSEAPGADFVRAPDGWWIDAVTGRSVESFPEGSSPDPSDPAHRTLEKEGEADDAWIVTANFIRKPCPEATAAPPPPPPPFFSPRVERVNFEVLAEINAARTHPAAFAERLLRGSHAPSVVEAAAFLKAHAPLPALEALPSLEASAARHAADQGRSGSRSHVGSDGSTVAQRIAAQGIVPAVVGEEIAFDADTGHGVARQLIVDEGVPDRGHRVSLFDSRLAFAGVSCHVHATYTLICVIDVAGPPLRR